MTHEQMQLMIGMHLAPYIQISTYLIGKSREAGGNMFRHQLDTMSILIDYGYIDSVLLKASLVHDILEDIPDFNHNILLSIDFESHAVYDLVQEVTRRPGEAKPDFLTRVRKKGSNNAKILKVADRISNMISLGFVNNLEFVERYINETERYLLPIAEEASQYMLRELSDLVISRRKYLEDFRHFKTGAENKESADLFN
jgi:(p)ppGpp synthase/HD superfamily hydrolase